MRRLAISLLSIGFLAGCEAPDPTGQWLLDDAETRIEAGECGVRHAHAEIAVQAGYFAVANQIRALRPSPVCPRSLALDPMDTGAVSAVVTHHTTATGGLFEDRAIWPWVGFAGVIDAGAKRAHQTYRELPQYCQPFARQAIPKRSGLVEIYLYHGNLHTTDAVKAYGQQMTPCAEAFRTAALAHHAAGEPDWAAFWLGSARLLGGGLEEDVARALSDRSEGRMADRYRLNLAYALYNRAMLADFDALARLAGDGAMAEAVAGDGDLSEMSALIVLAKAAGLQVHPAWEALGPDTAAYSFILTGWVESFALEGEETPAIFAAVRDACTLDPQPSLLDFQAVPGGVRQQDCRQAHVQVAVAAGLDLTLAWPGPVFDAGQ